MTCALVLAAALAADYKPFDPESVPEVQEAFAALAKGELTRCLDALNEVCKKHPLCPPPTVLAGVKLLDLGRIPQGRRMLEESAARMRGHPDVHLAFGLAGLREGRYCDASLQFTAAIEHAANERWSAEQRKQFLTIAHSGAAQVAELQGDWPRVRAALVYLKQAFGADSPALDWRLGRATFLVGDRNGGEDLIRAACRKEPKLLPADATMGELWLGVPGEAAKGDKLLAAAAAEFPKNERVQMTLLKRLLEVGDGVKSLAAGKAAHDALPDNHDFRLAFLLSLRQAGAFAECARQAKAWLAKVPQNAQVSKSDGRPLWPIYANQAALALAESDSESDRKEALELAEKAKAGLNPADALSTIGWCQHRLGKTDDGIKQLRDALATINASSDVAFYYAMALLAKGEVAAANRELDRALAAPGPFINRARAKELRKAVDPPAPPKP